MCMNFIKLFYKGKQGNDHWIQGDVTFVSGG